MLGCPECADEAHAQAAATPTCSAITSEAQCNAALGNSGAISRRPDSSSPAGTSSTADSTSLSQVSAAGSVVPYSAEASVGRRRLATAFASVVGVLFI